MRLALSTALVLAATTLAAHATPTLLTNGTFETGTLAGFTSTAATNGSNFGVRSGAAHTGNDAAFFGATTVGGYDSISQILATTAGTTYDLSFWLQTNGANGRDFQVLWDGTVVYDNSAAGTGTWTNTDLLLTATGSDTLTFSAYNVPSYDSLDDITLTPVAATPEPSSFALLGTGLLSAAATLRRRFSR